MKKVLVLNKKDGETPLACIEAFCRLHRGYQNVPITYAGRLDPMASGVLLALVGEECKNKEKYLKLDKEYEFEVLFGFATDTHDILGKVTKFSPPAKLGCSKVESVERLIKQNLKYFKGKFKQRYPVYSSKTVKGKQLWQYAREGEEVEMPEKEVNVKSLKFINFRKISNKNLLTQIEKRIGRVRGDFRQKEILEIWRKELKENREKEESKAFFFLVSFQIKCSSGTYVRSIAHELGAKISIPALAFSIKRKRIGKYKLK